MKTLEKTFVKNCDKSGDHKFIQVRRDGNVCLYRRETLEGRLIGFEVFTTKVIKAGTPLPGGGAEVEDREPYPGKSSFGRTAWQISGPDSDKRANERFEALVKGDVKVEEEIEVDSEETVQVARVVKGEVTLKLPDHPFTQKELAAFNNIENYKAVYGDLQKMLSTGVLKVSGERESTRGKSAKLFSKA